MCFQFTHFSCDDWENTYTLSYYHPQIGSMTYYTLSHHARLLTSTEYINVCRVSCGGMFNMLLVLSITFYFHYNIWGCMCSTGPFQYRWLKRYIYSSCYHHNQIGSIHLSHYYHIFPWLCAWDVCYIIFCHLLQIRSGKTGNLFSLYEIVGYVLAYRSYAFVCTVHHLISIIVQTYLKTLNL